MRSLLWLALCLLGAVDAAAASFDCGKAATPVEKTICNDPALSKSDERLAAAFADALKATLNPRALRAGQRQWLLERNKAADGAAIASLYETRLGALQATIEQWRAIPREIAEGELGQRCLALPDAPGDLACTVEAFGAVDDQDPAFHYQLQSYADDAARIGGAVIVLKRTLDETGRLRIVIAAYDEGAQYERPALTASRAARWLVLPGHLEGTGDLDAGLLFLVDPERSAELSDVDTDAWQRDLARRLPKGIGAWKGIFPDYAAMTAATALWQEGDGNCCPTAGRATIRLGLKGQRLVIDELTLKRGAAAARDETPAPAADGDRATDLCGKAVAYEANAPSFAIGPSAHDKAALATARDKAPALIHRAFKARCAKKTLAASEVAARIDSIVLFRADGADDFTAYFPAEKGRAGTLATEWHWTGTTLPRADDVSAGILCAFKPKLRMCQDRGP
jgi:uncharacterized protein YecT (DUF1311 family)